MSKKNFSRNISPNLKDAHYFCLECKKIFETRAYRIVKCPKCDSNIFVGATYNGWNYYLEKKYVSEIEIGDIILMRSDMKYHDVLNIEEYDDELYKIALEGDDFVECSNGIWDDNDKPWENFDLE